VFVRSTGIDPEIVGLGPMSTRKLSWINLAAITAVVAAVTLIIAKNVEGKAQRSCSMSSTTRHVSSTGISTRVSASLAALRHCACVAPALDAVETLR
jgi:hypothetical protein